MYAVVKSKSADNTSDGLIRALIRSSNCLLLGDLHAWMRVITINDNLLLGMQRRRCLFLVSPM